MADDEELKTYQKVLIAGFLYCSVLTILGLFTWGLIDFIKQGSLGGIGFCSFIIIMALSVFIIPLKKYLDNKKDGK